MKALVCLLSVIAIASASNTIAEQFLSQSSWKLVEWMSGKFIGMDDGKHYTSPIKLFDLKMLTNTSDWYNSKTYKIIRSFVGCESGISNGLDTGFTIYDIVESGTFNWQNVVFGALYAYAWY